MKKLILPVAFSLVILCGCASQYVMRLSNGREIVTPSKPKLKGSSFYFKDANGQEHAIPQSKVAEILPASMAAEEKKVPKYTTTRPKRHWWQFWRSSGG
jgi:hypothetical protein